MSTEAQEALPLAGKRIVVTRARSQASEQSKLIKQFGGEPYEFPVISIAWPEDLGPLDTALSRLAAFDWILFTSVNGVEMFFERLAQHNLEWQTLGQLPQVAAVGPKTAQALSNRGVQVAVVAEEFVGEGLLQTLGDRIQPGQRFLLPRADIARKQLPDTLREMGCEVTEVVAYRTLPLTENVGELVALLQAGAIHAVTFTSSSTVTNFVQALQGHDVQLLLDGVFLAAIGPITAKTAEELGLSIDVMPDTYTIPDLVDALVQTMVRHHP